MADDLPEYEDGSEYDAGFVRSGFVLIEEGLDGDGDHAFRFRYTVPNATALGLMLMLSDRIRALEASTGLHRGEDDEEDEGDEDPG